MGIGFSGSGNLGRDEVFMGLCSLDGLESGVLCEFVNETLR